LLVAGYLLQYPPNGPGPAKGGPRRTLEAIDTLALASVLPALFLPLLFLVLVGIIFLL
jgi:hypothetical protein